MATGGQDQAHVIDASRAVPLSRLRCNPHRNPISPRSYSFTRAGSLWVPERLRCANVRMALSPAFAHLHSGDSPLEWPGASELEAWYHWRFDRQYHSNLYATGTTPPAVTQSGTIPVGLGLRVECNATGGARGTAKFRYSIDNGATWEGGGSGTQFTTASTFNLNAPFSGVQLQFAVGTYTAGDLWLLKISQWRDQTGNGHHFSDLTGTPSRLPIPLVTAYGTGLQFDGSDDILQCTDTMAATLAGGADNDFTIFMVVKIDSTSPSSGAGALFFMGNSANNRSMHCYFSNTPNYVMRKWDDTPAAVNVTGGTPNTTIHILAFRQTGTTAQVFVDGTSVVGPTAQDLAGMTGLDNSAIGGSYLSGARGNHGAHTYYSMAAYRSGLDVATIQDLSGRYRADVGF